jgi:membrane fusion protein, multidrug efflux system
MEAKNQSANQNLENTLPEKKNRKKLFIIAGILGTVLIIGIIYFVISANYESTDNAQLDADIVPIRSSVSGYIKTRFINYY